MPVYSAGGVRTEKNARHEQRASWRPQSVCRQFTKRLEIIGLGSATLVSAALLWGGGVGGGGKGEGEGGGGKGKGEGEGEGYFAW